MRPLVNVAEPDWRLGRCTTHPHRDWWTSPLPSERQAAIDVCSGCPVATACAAWAVAVIPSDDNAVWGGLYAAERHRLRAELRRQIREEAARERERQAARLAAQRDAGRRSERLRRLIGKAETAGQQRERYAADPEPRKAYARAYYAARAEEVKAKRRARHERDREQVNAKRREQYARSRAA